MALPREDKYRYLGLGDPTNVNLISDVFDLSFTVNKNDRPFIPLSGEINVDVTANNTSTDTKNTNIIYSINGEVKDSQYIELAGGNSTTITLESGILLNSSYNIKVNCEDSTDSLDTTVTL